MFIKRMLLGALLIVALGQTTALAHGDLADTIPSADTELKKPPSHLIINFTEPPTKNSVVQVRDGCGDEITDSVDFADSVAHVFTDKGQPGEWKVSYEVVSAQDGHKTEGSYGFKILGKKDCATEEKPNPNGNGGGSGQGPEANDGGGTGDGVDSSFPVVPVVIGGAGVIALALVARRLAG